MDNLEESAEKCAEEINSLGSAGADRYVVLKGEDAAEREAFASKLRPKVNVPVYVEEQFPNSEGKTPIELSDYA
jgi:hypothetical protein